MAFVVSWPEHRLTENDAPRSRGVPQSRKSKKQKQVYPDQPPTLSTNVSSQRERNRGKRVSNDEEKQDDNTDVMVIAMRAILVRLFILIDILPERFLALPA
jgi:hypothetical protein